MFSKKSINYHFFGGQKPWNFNPWFCIGLVPKFYKVLEKNPMNGFNFNWPNHLTFCAGLKLYYLPIPFEIKSARKKVVEACPEHLNLKGINLSAQFLPVLIKFSLVVRLIGTISILAFSQACKPKFTIVERGIEAQTLHVGNGLEPQDLDPHIITGTNEIKILSALFEGLIGQDPKDLRPVPAAAESWTISEDGLTCKFHLRDNLYWNNGDKVTSEDFKFGIQRILTPQLAAKNAYLLFVLKNAEAFNNGELNFDSVGVSNPNESTLILELENPAPYLLSLLFHPAWFPVHRTSLEAQGDPFARSTSWTQPESMVSNGPFRLADWRVNEYIHLERSPSYWDDDTTKLNQIFFYPTENLDAEERAFQGGQLHLTEAIPVSKVGYYREQSHPALQINPYLGTYYLQLNTRNTPLSDPRVRTALSLVINRDQIVGKITKGNQKPAWHFTPPDTAGYNTNYISSKNVDQARSLLTEAGYPNGENFPVLKYLYNTSENHKAIGEALQQMWRSELGIRVQLENQEWKVYTQSRENGSFDILRSSWVGDYLDPSTFLDVWTSDSGNNFTGWSSPQYDTMIEETRRLADVGNRFSVFEIAEKLMLSQQPIIPLYFYNSVFLKHSAVKGFYPTLLNYHPWKHVYLETPKP